MVEEKELLLTKNAPHLDTHSRKRHTEEYTMNGLPPREIATINTSLLQQPSPAWQASFAKLFSYPQELTSTHFRPWMALSFVAILPLGIVFWAQPNTPQLKAHNQKMVSSYLAQQQRPANQVASAYQEAPSETTAPAPANLASTDSFDPTSQTDLASSSNIVLSSEQKAYRYNLTLAQGFLRKAIQTSQETASTQTANDKNTILSYLEQALTAANTAVDLDPTNGLGFLLRARIYKTASTIQPELAAKGDQDLTIAQALGVQDIDILNENVLDHLPTQQATNLAGGPVIADTEEGSNTVVQTGTTNNSRQGEVVLPANQTEIFVPFTQLTDTMKISVQVSPNSPSRPHTPLRVSSRKNGQGFTIQSFNSLNENVTLFWRIVE